MISSITLINFRKFEKINLDTNSNLVILQGNNAFGKTTVLEAIYLISTFKSHRTNDTSNLINEKSEFSKITLINNHKYEIILSKKNKKSSIDGISIKKARDFVGNLHIVMFSPSDLDLITGSPRKRRNFLDIELSLLNKKYLDCLSKAKYFLKQRNDYLKTDNINLKMLDVLTSQLISEETLIIKSRKKFINLLNEKLIKVHKFISNGEIAKLKYIETLDLNNSKEDYKKSIKKDKIYKTTSIGFHRDDFEIFLNNRNINEFASQGQIRNVAISIKISLVMVYESYLKESPILLLDDVFSELDYKRQTNLVKFLINRPQTFITTTSLDGIVKEILSKALIIKL